MSAPASFPFVVARLGAERYGFDVAAVREVVAVGALASVPARSAAVRGLIPHRERFLPVVSLAALLAGGAPPVEPGGSALVVTMGGADLALEVDEVEAVVDGDAEFVGGSATGSLPARGVWRWGSALVTVLDVALLAERVTALEEPER
ncbi:MAG TPA: chemotaxis protein CheW [Gemmatimonadales bacterium]|nr:chemotaxis protein CheW [Gemmatimonadales bacterium]